MGSQLSWTVAYLVAVALFAVALAASVMAGATIRQNLWAWRMAWLLRQLERRA